MLSDAEISRGIGRHESYLSQARRRGQRELVKWLQKEGINGFLEWEQLVANWLLTLKIKKSIFKTFEDYTEAQVYYRVVNRLAKGERMKPNTVYEVAKKFNFDKKTISEQISPMVKWVPNEPIKKRGWRLIKIERREDAKQ